MIIAEAVRDRLQRRERCCVGLLLRGVHASRRERHFHIHPGILRGFFHRGGTAEDDQIGERDFLVARLRVVEVLPDRFELVQHRPSCAGLLTSQSFCGARRMRAPLAPPRLSEPRNVEADAQAVETSCGTVRPDARTFAFSAAMSLSLDQRHDRRAGTGSCQISVSFGTSLPR